MKNLNLLFAFFLLGIFGCQSDTPKHDPNLPTTFAQYRIEFFQMIEKDLKKYGVKYRFEFVEDFEDKYIFQYKDSLKVDVKQEVDINLIEDYSVDGFVSKSKGVTLNWVGKPLEENESLVFMISANQRLSNFEHKGKTSDSEIMIPAERLASLDEGKAKIYLVRKKSEKQKQANLETYTETEFYTFEKNVIIKP